MVMFE